MLKSKKQEAFAQHYALHGKPSEAYHHAYDTARMKAQTIAVKASELLRDGNVAVRVKELRDVIAEKADRHFHVNAETVLARLQEIDNLDVADIMDDKGQVLPVRKWPRQWRISISGLEVTQLKEGDVDVRKLKLPDKLRNLQMLGRHVEVQAFKDRVEHDISQSLAEQIIAARERAREAMKKGDEHGGT